ncbi:hypothetical protein B296_00028637 [Ensete ventricosum]|uniref:Clathrin/coatomer adaptor adaptin-like N-terminal domain-containing protein n=1 Tax=Ensete ventricosum TaxID=4639 RepID=A0A427AMM4_ENSVE|nr:hypothetical protein B296_00028637 [Ensete ventricosum]
MIIFLSPSFACNYSSIRRRALDLLYGMCDVTNAKDIVEELLQSPPPRAGKKSLMLPSFPRRLRRGEGDKTKTMAKKLPPREVLIRGVVPWFFGRRHLR